MKNKKTITGIVVEYNPFHNGHIYHIEKTKEITQCDVLIAVMSPNFVQRGEPALVDKWERTKAALEHGVDIVLELPTHLTLQSAEIFAKRSVEILSLAKIDTLVYGAESLDTPVLQSVDKDLLKQGYSYAYAKNVNALQANQILGAYYEEAANTYNIRTKRILRTNAYHDLDITDSIASASAIRSALKHNKVIDHTTPMNLKDMTLSFVEDAYPFIRYQILTQQKNIKNYLLVDEGIENLFIKLAKLYDTYADFIEHAVSKRYTMSRIQRTLCHILLETPRVLPNIKNVRVLGMSEIGKKYLGELDSPYLTTSFKQYAFKDIEEKSTAVYSLINKKGTQLLQREMGPPIII